MKYIAIDQSFTNSGIVIIENDVIIHAESFSTDKNKNIFSRAVQLVARLSVLAKNHNPEFIAIEGLAFGMRGSATRDLAGLQFIIVAWLQEIRGFEFEIVSPKSVKKFATGSGKASKVEMFDALPQKIKVFLVDDLGLKKTKGLYDVTDAYHIGKLALYQRTNNKK